MGVLYSMPLCSRGEAKDGQTPVNNAAGVDRNNNEPMPVRQHAVLTQQPSGLENPHANAVTGEYPEPAGVHSSTSASVHPPPDATSTPKELRVDSLLAPPIQRVGDGASNYSDSLESDPEGRVIDDEYISDHTSDSGLENSADDELDGRRRGVEADDLTLGEDEGVHEDALDETINLDDDEEDEMEDPVERPPAPTVPDDDEDDDVEEVIDDGASSTSTATPTPLEDLRDDKPQFYAKQEQSDSNTRAFSNLLSELAADHHRR